MKRRLLSVLLVLTMCVGLAVSAFAEPAEELSAPEETEVLHAEEIPVPEEKEVLPTEEAPALEEAHEHEEESENVIFVRGVPYYVCSGGENDSLFWLRPMSEVDSVMTVPVSAQNAEEGINAISNESKETDLRYFFVARPGFEMDMELFAWERLEDEATSLQVDHDHRMVYDKHLGSGYQQNENQHRTWDSYSTYCIIVDCTSVGTVTDYGEWEPHSWKKGSYAGSKSSSGSTHVAEYNYTCNECGKTTTKTESHSLTKTDFGDDYHRGALHYVEWFFRCTTCGYRETRWESQSCPGNNNGEGCIFGINKVEPPVEEQDVTEPEETNQTE